MKELIILCHQANYRCPQFHVSTFFSFEHGVGCLITHGDTKNVFGVHVTVGVHSGLTTNLRLFGMFRHRKLWFFFSLLVMFTEVRKHNVSMVL